MAVYVKGRVTLAKLRDICNEHGFSSFMLMGRLIDLSWNLDDKQHQVKIRVKRRHKETPNKRGKDYEEQWPDDFRYYLEHLPVHVGVRVEADREVPRVVVMKYSTRAFRAEVQREKKLND